MPNRLLDGRDNPIQRKGLYMPLVGILITAMVAFIFYRIGEHDWVQQLSTLTIAIAFLTSALVIAVFTEAWKWRVVGLFVAVLGTGLSYGFLFLVAMHNLSANTPATRASLRASLCVGGTILFVGIIGWSIERRRGSQQPLLDAIDPRTNYREPR